MSVIWSNRRLHCLLNRPGANQRRHKAPRHWPLWGDSTGDPWIPLVDSPYKGPVTRRMFPFDDFIMLFVLNPGTETFSGYVRHPNEQFHLSHGRELMFVTSVKNVPKCLTLSTLEAHLVVFKSVIVHVSHWFQSQNIMQKIRWKAKAILPPIIKLFADGTKTNSLGLSISKVYPILKYQCSVYPSVFWERISNNLKKNNRVWKQSNLLPKMNNGIS